MQIILLFLIIKYLNTAILGGLLQKMKAPVSFKICFTETSFMCVYRFRIQDAFQKKNK
jgi:hypothetical protein